MSPRAKHIAAALLFAGCGLAGAQDAGKALGGLLRSINPAASYPNAAAPAASNGNELLKLLGDSVDRVDEARELEIGRDWRRSWWAASRCMPTSPCSAT
jgi:hypothetical protein